MLSFFEKKSNLSALLVVAALEQIVHNQAHQYINEHVDQNFENVAFWNQVRREIMVVSEDGGYCHYNPCEMFCNIVPRDIKIELGF